MTHNTQHLGVCIRQVLLDHANGVQVHSKGRHVVQASASAGKQRMSTHASGYTLTETTAAAITNAHIVHPFNTSMLQDVIKPVARPTQTGGLICFLKAKQGELLLFAQDS